jgi:hypothetical protein
MVVDRLLSNCNPSPQDIHDSSVGSKGRGESRDKDNRNRAERLLITKRVYMPIRQQTWDTPAFCDFNGIWCDRLILGGPGVRCATLQPFGPIEQSYESVTLALRAFPQLRPWHDLIVFCEARDQPLGKVRCFPLRSPSDHKGADRIRRCITELSPRVDETGSSLCIRVGVGDDALMQPFTAPEKEELDSAVIPKLTFACATWIHSPTKAVRIAQEPQPINNLPLYATLQRSMLSYRDTKILDAYETGIPLDSRMTEETVRAKAQQILGKLRDHQS